MESENNEHLLELLLEDNQKNPLPKKLSHPLFGWDIISQAISPASNYLDLIDFQKLAIRHQWILANDLLRHKKFDALVITNAQQKIKWVSNGFRGMTGYAPTYALGKSPNFLQGKNSSLTSRVKIRHALAAKHSVEASLINYRKDGSEYNCHIEIVPLFTHENQLTHFLAIERLEE